MEKNRWWKRESDEKEFLCQEYYCQGVQEDSFRQLRKRLIYLFFQFILSRHVLLMVFEMLFFCFLLLYLVVIWVSRGWSQSLWMYKWIPEQMSFCLESSPSVFTQFTLPVPLKNAVRQAYIFGGNGHSRILRCYSFVWENKTSRWTLQSRSGNLLEQNLLPDSVKICCSKDINSFFGFSFSFFYRFYSVVQYLPTICFSTLILYCWASNRLWRNSAVLREESDVHKLLYFTDSATFAQIILYRFYHIWQTELSFYHMNI